MDSQQKVWPRMVRVHNHTISISIPYEVAKVLGLEKGQYVLIGLAGRRMICEPFRPSMDMPGIPDATLPDGGVQPGSAPQDEPPGDGQQDGGVQPGSAPQDEPPGDGVPGRAAPAANPLDALI